MTETEAMPAPCDESATLAQHGREECLRELPGAMGFGIRQRRAFWSGGDAEMHQPAQTALQPATYLPQRVGLGKLGEEHGNELLPTGEPFSTTLCVQAGDESFEFKAGEELQELTEETGGTHQHDNLRFGE